MSLFAGTRLVVLDTETTGLDPEGGHHVVEVACVPVDDGVVGEPWSRLVNPGGPIPFEATRVHGITNDMVRSEPRAVELSADLEARCADRILVFHHAAFDLPFLHADFRLPLFENLMTFEGPSLFGPGYIDTLGLARGLNEPGGNALGELARRLAVEPSTAHRAGGDALTTARVLLKLGERWEGKPGVRSVDDLARKSREVAPPVSRRLRA